MSKILVTTIPAALLAATFGLPLEAQPAPPHFMPPSLATLMEAADTNKDGAISRTELAAIDVFAKLDTNKDGKIDGSDVDRFFSFRGPQGTFLLRVADEDEDGKLTRADWQTFISKSDSDGDGVLESAELRSVMPAPPAPPEPPEAPAPPDPPAAMGAGAPARPAIAPRPPLPPLPPPPPELDASELAELFDRFDANQDGLLEAAELPPSRLIWRQRFAAEKAGKAGG